MRVPYPYAAWPEDAPRPWELQLPEDEPVSGLIRSDPSLLPIGAVRRKKAFPVAPPPSQRADDYNAPARSAESELAKLMGKKDPKMIKNNSGSEATGLVDMILQEFELRIPVFKPFFQLLRGQYTVEAKPSPPASSLIGIPG